MLTTAAINQKGGVGKSALVAGTAGALLARGRRVLAIDLDPQGHLTTEALKLKEAASGDKAANMFNALRGTYKGQPSKLTVRHSVHTAADGSVGVLDVLPTTFDMFFLDRELYARTAQMENRLSWLIQAIADDLASWDAAYDHVLIDCPPALNILTENALVATDGVLLPVQPERSSIRALRLLLGQLRVIEESNRLAQRTIFGLVPSVYRRPLAGINVAMFKKFEAMPLDILALFPSATVVQQAWATGTPVPLFQPESPSAQNYHRLAIRLDVAAGLSPASEWDALPPVSELTKITEDTTA
uniref:ParA family protein n=1 Tax=Amycolatopsis sp. CA-293810 TaxID=3239926 RepID=UPI003F497FC7